MLKLFLFISLILWIDVISCSSVETTPPSCSQTLPDYRVVFEDTGDYTNITASSSFQFVLLDLNTIYFSCTVVTTHDMIYVSNIYNRRPGTPLIYQNSYASLPSNTEIVAIFPSRAKPIVDIFSVIDINNIYYWVILKDNPILVREVHIFTSNTPYDVGSYTAMFDYTGRSFNLNITNGYSHIVKKVLQNFPCFITSYGEIPASTVLITEDTAIIVNGQYDQLPSVEYLSFSNNHSSLIDGYVSYIINTGIADTIWIMTFVVEHLGIFNTIVYQAIVTLSHCPTIPSPSSWAKINDIYTTDQVQFVTTLSAVYQPGVAMVLSATKTGINKPLVLAFTTKSNLKYTLTGIDSYIDNTTVFGPPGTLLYNCENIPSQGYRVILTWMNQDTNEMMMGLVQVSQYLGTTFCMTNSVCSLDVGYHHENYLKWQRPIIGVYSTSGTCNYQIYNDQVIPHHGSDGQFKMIIAGYRLPDNTGCLPVEELYHSVEKEIGDSCSCLMVTGESCCTFQSPCQSPCGNDDQQTYCVNTGADSCCCDQNDCSCY